MAKAKVVKVEVVNAENLEDVLENLEAELEKEELPIILKEYPDEENPTHYINNKKFCQALIEYKEKILEAEAKGLPKPRIPEYIGECFLKLAVKISNRPNFINYPCKEDMIGDAIENCLMYLTNFDPERSKNAFGYFTKYVWNAFLRRMEKEEVARYTRAKEWQRFSTTHDSFNVQDHDLDEEYHNNIEDYMRDNESIIKDFEEKLARKKTKIKLAKKEKEVKPKLLPKKKVKEHKLAI